LSGIVALASPLVSLPFINTPITYVHISQNSVSPLEQPPEHPLNHSISDNISDTHLGINAENKNQDYDDSRTTNSISVYSRNNYTNNEINTNSISATNGDNTGSTIQPETNCDHPCICPDCYAVGNKCKGCAICNPISVNDVSFVYNGTQQKLDDVMLHDGATQITYTYEPILGTGAELGEDNLPLSVGEYIAIAVYSSIHDDIGSFDHQMSFLITPAPLTLANIHIQSKEYDGTTIAEYEFNSEHNIKLEGSFGNDEVEISMIGTPFFLDAYAGYNKFVAFTGFELSGTHARNYYLVYPDFVTANIYKTK